MPRVSDDDPERLCPELDTCGSGRAGTQMLGDRGSMGFGPDKVVKRLQGDHRVVADLGLNDMDIAVITEGQEVDVAALRLGGTRAKGWVLSKHRRQRELRPDLAVGEPGLKTVLRVRRVGPVETLRHSDLHSSLKRCVFAVGEWSSNVELHPGRERSFLGFGRDHSGPNMQTCLGAADLKHGPASAVPREIAGPVGRDQFRVSVGPISQLAHSLGSITKVGDMGDDLVGVLIQHHGWRRDRHLPKGVRIVAVVDEDPRRDIEPRHA